MNIIRKIIHAIKLEAAKWRQAWQDEAEDTNRDFT